MTGQGMTRFGRGLLLTAIVALLAFDGWQLAARTPAESTPAHVRTMTFQPYEPQKALYHITDGAGVLAAGRWRNLLQMARNHVAAVGPEWLDLRILLQGDGLDLLRRARNDPDLASRIDRLKKDGVRFLVCLNTITGQNMDPEKTLYGVRREDIIQAGMAEAAALVQQGYAYLKPMN